MNDKNLIPSTNEFPVVGIGASAGGLDAFKKLLKAITIDSGMAYVLVQHLDPTHESMLTEILQKVTKIPVLEISDDIKVSPNHIYILPSNKMMIANDGVLELSPRIINKNERNLPIDLFFKSLAEIHNSHAIGVVLSGTGSDGTAGLKSIKEHGGITFAQDEKSAAYDGMPTSAVQAEVVDFIITPEEIPAKLLEITSKTYKSEADLQNLSKQEETVYKQILALLSIRKGTDFTHYKQTTIRRRILRRMALNKNEEEKDYLKFLRANIGEQDILYQDFLIPVTSFFRDTAVFDNLCETIFPNLLENQSTIKTIRIWIAGCSTGQEAYSMAICIQEFLNKNNLAATNRVQIFATDLSEPAISKARTGIYNKNELEGLSASRLKSFFTETNLGYQINKETREMCVFAVHNFIKDPPFSKVDFLSCRNVLIYMEPYIQKKALSAFHYAINPSGFLLLGKSETITSVPELFVSAGKQDKLFIRKNVPSKFMHSVRLGNQPNKENINTIRNDQYMRTDFQKTADEIMLSKYTPAGVVVNEAMDIVHFRGKTGNYLEQSPGKPSHNLLQMAKNGLSFELRNIIHKVKKEQKPLIKDNIPVDVNGNQHAITIEAIPLTNITEPHYLILFHDGHLGSVNQSTPIKKATPSKQRNDERDLRIAQLEKELEQSRDDMRAITDDQEAVNEELQSANEELLSGSEELQSLNEELETSKEELQSTNEELIIINHEMIDLNVQITESRNYAEAIIATIHEPLLVLDQNLRVKSANNAFYNCFKMIKEETEGVLISALGNQEWDNIDLRKMLEKILSDKSSFKDFEISQQFSNIGKRILLLTGKEIVKNTGNENLILLVIEDITNRKQVQLNEIEFFSRFQNIVLQAPVGITIFRNTDFVVEMANSIFLELIDKKETEFVNKPLFDTIPEIKELIGPLLLDVLRTKNSFHANEFELKMNRFGKNEIGYFNLVFQPFIEKDGQITGIVCVVNEVTAIVIARKKMEVQALMVENLLMTAPGFISTLYGPEHVYNFVNPMFQQLFGNRKIIGKTIREAFPELAGQKIFELFDRVYSTGEVYLGIEIPVLIGRENPNIVEKRFFNLSFQPMYDENKTIYAVLVYGYEVTEQVILKNKDLENHQLRSKELEETIQQRTLDIRKVNLKLKEKNDELEKINNELKSFAYVSSHDLQEPLRKVQTFISRILETDYANLSEAGKDYFHRMNNTARRMQTLIEDLLSFSNTNTNDRKFENTSLEKIIEDVKNDLSDTIQENNATIEVGNLCNVFINPFQMRQVMHNLINNSIKFTKANDNPHIIITSKIATTSDLIHENPELKAKKMLLKKKYCHITFSDNGIGFKPQYKDLIFEVFQRLNGKEDYAGTGIGLSIVKKIIQNHNGFILASSELDKGATFDIYIPEM